MADSSDVADWDSDSFWSAQDFQTSARLHLQHWIFNYQLRYALHPSINTTGPSPIKVADIGTGNGAWLLEVIPLFPSPSSVTLAGFDITPSNFPAAAWLPPNMSLHVWNAYSEVPAEHVGAYDIVHMRAMTSTIIENKIDPLLANALQMLKPGGYLQWDENDASKLACSVPDPSVDAKAAHTIVKLQQVFSRGFSKLLPDWLYSLPSTLEERGCEIVAHEVSEAKKELARATTDNYLLVWKDLIRLIPETPMPLPPGMELPETLSRQSFAELVQKAIQETSKGASLTMPFHVTVARKRS